MPTIFLILLACSTPEEDAQSAAVAFLEAQLKQDLPRVHAAACSDERAAKPLSDLLDAKNDLENAGLLGAAAKELAEKVAEQGRIAPTAVALDEAKTSGTVHYEVFMADEKTASSSLDVRLEDAGWCVVPGWVVEKQAEQLDVTLEASFSTAATAMNEDRYDEAEHALVELRDAAARVPEAAWTSRTTREMAALSESLETIRSMKARHVGGRWLVDEAKDPMTDQINATAQLRSTNEVESWGRQEPATLVVRCQRGDFEVYLSTPFVLDSDWRYDSVSGQFRFGSAAPQRLRATRSKDMKAAFLRDPRSWAQDLVEHQGEKWTIEVSPYNEGATAFFFDLAAADKAVPRILAACPK